MWKRAAIGVLLLLAIVAGFFVWRIGPRNLIGMLLYDQRREGPLRVGDVAPDVPLVSLEGEIGSLWSRVSPEKPVVLIFGSFT